MRKDLEKCACRCVRKLLFRCDFMHARPQDNFLFFSIIFRILSYSIFFKECPGETIHFNFDSIFGDFFYYSNTKYKKVKSAAEN